MELHLHLRIDGTTEARGRLHFRLSDVGRPVGLRSQILHAHNVMIDHLHRRDSHRRKLQSHLPADGTHTDEMRDLLHSQFPWATLRSWELSKPLVPESANFLFDYAEQQAMGKRLIAYSTFPLEAATLFLDSDVFFYMKAAELLSPAFAGPQHWFLPDMDWGTLDTRFLAKNSRDLYQLNGGFYLLKPGFSWDPVFHFLKQLENKFEYFSDQTAFHVAFKEQAVMALDPRVFVLHCNDQFKLGLSESPREMAIRHFVAMVRHKIWEPGWRWHLAL